MGSKHATEFVLSREHIELCQLLKAVGLAESGGAGKHLVAAGEVSVDGKPEARKTAKIRAGQTVRCRGVTILVQPQKPGSGSTF